MLVVDERLGHREDRTLADRLAGTDHARVVLSDTDRRRSRVRTTTVDGRDLGIVVAKDLANGDVLEAEDGTLVVVELEGVEALVLDIAAAGLSPTVALELGHALGNRHWDLTLWGEEALFPVVTSRERTETVVSDVVPEEVPYRFETVPPTTFDDENGHATGADHTHRHDAAHSHSHEADIHGHNGHSHTPKGDGTSAEDDE